jgi:hypothetical protein
MTRREIEALLQSVRIQLFGQTAERQIRSSRDRPRSRRVRAVSSQQAASAPSRYHGERISEILQ